MRNPISVVDLERLKNLTTKFNLFIIFNTALGRSARIEEEGDIPDRTLAYLLDDLYALYKKYRSFGGGQPWDMSIDPDSFRWISSQGRQFEPQIDVIEFLEAIWNVAPWPNFSNRDLRKLETIIQGIINHVQSKHKKRRQKKPFSMRKVLKHKKCVFCGKRSENIVRRACEACYREQYGAISDCATCGGFGRIPECPECGDIGEISLRRNPRFPPWL